MSKVRVGARYIFVPNVMDLAMPEHYRATRGQVVKVVRMRGAPPPGTMGQVHIEDARSGEFLGMVSVHSLIPEAQAGKVNLIGAAKALGKIEFIRVGDPVKKNGRNTGLEVRRVFLLKFRGKRVVEGTMDDHDDVESYPLKRIPREFRGFSGEFYGVYPVKDHDPRWSFVDSSEIYDSPEEAQEEIDRIYAAEGFEASDFRRNPDDFRHDDGGSERRRLGPGGVEGGPGGIMFHGPAGVETYRLLTIRSGLKAETMGMRLTRGVSCLKLAKQVTGLKAGTAKKMLPLYEAWLRERGILRD